MRLVRNKLENSDVQKFTAEYIFPASCEIKIRNRCAYVELLKIFFLKKKVFSADNCFLEIQHP